MYVKKGEAFKTFKGICKFYIRSIKLNYLRMYNCLLVSSYASNYPS